MPTSTDEWGLPSPRAVLGAVDLLSAMSHPIRLRVLLALGRQGPLSVGTLTELCETEQSAMSHQLRVLRDAHLVRPMRRGKHVYYALDDDHVTRVIEDVLAHASEDRA